MKRACSYALPLNLSALACRAAWFGVLGALLLGAATQRPAHAITIDMEYTDEGDDPPHDENPSWDGDGAILKAHFQRAKQIWEDLLLGDEEYTFDYHWDNDIDGLGLTTDGIDTYIEINPDYDWFADPTPGDDVEFTLTQTLFNRLSGPDQSTYFPGTPPPGTLEVGYRGTGLPIHPLTGMATTSASGIASDNASNSYDLLSTVVHEIGHILGISGVEPGEYNIYPHHVGGLEDVLVLEDDDSGHLAGEGTVPFLMCESCGALGVRRFASATDVLVIAQDQGITDVHLQRVGSISSGVWGDQSKWIGADVPDLTQDVYITHGGATTLNANAQAKSLRIGSGSSVDAQTYRLSVDGPLNFNGAAASVGAGGTIEADSISGTNGALTTAAGSTVRFNSFTAGSSTSVTFNGSVAIGYNKNLGGLGTFSSVFNPSTISNWNVAQELAIGDKNTITTLVIDGGATFRSATGQIGADAGGSGRGIVNIDGVGSSWTISGRLDARNGSLNIANQGRLTVGGDVDIRGAIAAGSQVAVASGGILNVTGDITVGPYGMATFGDDTRAGFNGIRNEGAAIANGPGGLTMFTGNSSAANGVFVNDGGTVQSSDGGATRFSGNAKAGDSIFINNGGTTIWAEGGQTAFSGASTAESATFTNAGPTGLYAFAGKTLFNDFASADRATITNLPASGDPTTTDFYGMSTAGGTPTALGATIINQSGAYPTVPGITTFHDDSSAGRGTFINESNSGGTTGQFIFNDSSTAGQGTFTNGGLVSYGHVTFNDNSTAGQANIFVRGPGDSRVMFFDNSSAGAATIDVGPLVFEPVNVSNLAQFNQNSTAAYSNITVRGDGGSLSFAGNYNANGNASATADHATIVALGSTRPGNISGTVPGQVLFYSWSTAGNATITAEGATVAGAPGGGIGFLNGGHAGNATLIANGGASADNGGGIRFQGGGVGDSARLVVNSGAYADFSLNASHGGTAVGSIEGAGRFSLGGSLLTVGNLNTSTTVSGTITDAGGYTAGAGGMLTKVGSGTLTLSGANTHTGLTTVDEGTLVINGSIAGGAVVKDGGILKGIGSMGNVAVESGGVFAPGTSPGTITVAGLNLMGGSTLEYELGGATRDRIFVTNNGNVTLGGVLKLSLLDGFNPPLGQVFSLFEGPVGSITGTFSAVDAPTFNGQTLNVLYGANQVTLQVGEAGSYLAADFNEDGSVDGDDLARWRTNFGAGATHMQGDADGDADVDGGDFLIWQRQLGGMSPDPGARQVPEPAAFTLLSIACCGLSLTRPQRC